MTLSEVALKKFSKDEIVSLPLITKISLIPHWKGSKTNYLTWKKTLRDLVLIYLKLVKLILC